MEHRALSKAAIVVVIAVIITASFFGVYLAGFIHLGAGSQTVKLIGVCKVTSYFYPDNEQILVRNVTTTTDNTTSYYLTTYSTITPPIKTLGSSTYTTTTYAKNSTGYVITNTTNENPFSPSAQLAVSTCAFAP